MRVICYTSSTLRKRKNKKAKKRKACRTFSSLERGSRRTSVESRILYIGIRESMKMFWVFLSDRKPHRRPVWPSDLSDSLATCLVDSWFHFVWIWEACWCVPSEVCFFSDFLPLNFNLSFNGKAPTNSRPGCTDLRASSSHRSWAEGSSLYVCTGGEVEECYIWRWFIKTFLIPLKSRLLNTQPCFCPSDYHPFTKAVIRWSFLLLQWNNLQI